MHFGGRLAMRLQTARGRLAMRLLQRRTHYWGRRSGTALYSYTRQRAPRCLLRILSSFAHPLIRLVRGLAKPQLFTAFPSILGPVTPVTQSPALLVSTLARVELALRSGTLIARSTGPAPEKIFREEGCLLDRLE